VDSAEAHFKAWRDFLKEHGVDYTRDVFKRNFGKRDDAVIKEYLPDLPEEEVWGLSEKKEAYFRKVIKPDIKALPGVLRLIESLGENGFKVGLGSSANSENVRLVLQTLRIAKYFDAVGAGREATESKPSPQLFLLVARKLNVPPERCIVVEDAVVGVEAAKRAGMKALAVTNTHPKERFSEADLVVSSLKEVSADRLKTLLDGRKPSEASFS